MSKGRSHYKTEKKKKTKEQDPLKAKKEMVNLAIIVIGVAIGILLGMTLNSMSMTKKGDKTVGFEVTVEDQTSTIKANVMAEDLLGAIEQCKDITVVEGKIIKVGDRTAESSEGEYWSVYDGDTEVTDALKETPVTDNQRFKIVLNK